MNDRPGHPVEWLPEYALGVLSESEAEPIRAHIETCDECRAEYEQMAGVARLLPLAAEVQAPDTRVRDRLMERVRTEPRSVSLRRESNRRWMGAAAIAASVIVLVGAGSFLAGRATVDDTPGELVEQQEAIVLAAAHGTLDVSHGGNGEARVSVIRAPAETSSFAWVEGLPVLPDGKAFQAWFTQDGETFEPSDVFAVHDGGVWLAAGSPMERYIAMAFTIEDAEGVDAPTQDPFIVIPLVDTAASR